MTKLYGSLSNNLYLRYDLPVYSNDLHVHIACLINKQLAYFILEIGDT